ncbi:hypothetical protein B7P33_06805 [Sediminicola luteus]|uniref:Uncharacterized protein n=2 Tax=Sediminicola luteus TaxID=319238 RepID=A0A2A4G7C1_9FLAO|nr:hypothetical protein B7P33_06805 [Sediminicola luteus]
MALDSNERPNRPIAKFESMLKTDDVYFFDAEDFEDIVHHYLNNGKIALGKKAIKIGLEQHPHSVPLKLLEVEVLVFENELDKAGQLLDRLQELDQNNEEIYIQRANIYSKRDNHEAAAELLRHALTLSEDDLDIHSLLGMEYLFMDKYDQAKTHFITCVAQDPYDYASLYNVVYCFEFLEDYNGAILYLNDYLENNPYCEVAWHQLGKLYANKSMLKEALSAFDFAIISDDTFVGAYLEKGRVLERMGLYGRAIECYEASVELEDPTSYAFLRIGKCHEALGNMELAKYYYYQTVHEDPLLEKGWLAITDFHIKVRDFDKAKKYINKALNIDDKNAFYWIKNALIHTHLEMYHDAEASYRQAVELGNYEMDTWLAWAKTLLLLEEAEAASLVLKQGLEYHPESPELRFYLIGCYHRCNDMDALREQLEIGLKSHKNGMELLKRDFPKLYESSWVRQLVKEKK